MPQYRFRRRPSPGRRHTRQNQGCWKVSCWCSPGRFQGYSPVAVGRSQAAHLGDADRAVHEYVVAVDDVTVLLAVKVGDQGKLGVQEVVLLSKDLSTHA